MHYFTNRRGRLTTIMKSLNRSSSVMSPRILVFASLILPFFVSMALAEVHYYDFIVKEVNFTRLCENKLMLVVNESYPGPPIRARKGDTIYVNVYNEGFYGFTIHWHGVKQPRNPWFDGPEYVTQCPIAPGTNFTYQVQLTEEEGTVWWHAHSDWTRASVHGAIVVLPALGTMFPFPEPDEEEIIVFGSWYLGNLRERVEESLQPGSTETLPQSDAYTINGQPGDFLPCSINATWRRKVDHGKTYLLRLVNANIDAEFFFAIAEHNLTVVGLDGAYTKPINTRYIVVTPGQTMDVLLYANSTPGLYYMAGRQYLSTTSDTGFDHMNATAILQYNGNYTTTDAPLFPEHLPMYMSQAEAFNFTNKIRSLASPEHPVNVPKESEITTRMFITASMNSLYCAPDLGPTCVNISFATSVNNISWVNPTTDSILQAYYRNISNPIYETDFPDQPPTYFNFTDGGTTMSTVLTVQGTKVKVLDYNETVEIVFQGTNVMGGAVNHPMHLHGHSFYVLGFGFGPFDPVKDPKGYNLVDPPYVATFVTPKNGWLTIRFVADNPGVWFWHCHVDRHMTWGMEAAFIIKDGGTAETSMLPPPAQMPSCDVPLDSAIRNYEALIEKQME
ncbi:PREDICTED: laccase-14-like [Fragaria vesca subsp. vesca]|uniref:laccase-14-like n=1 Tax=Fragaria vesca subsp. vesca TaxID=101020 RepID=UPI0002C33631|nr:PREDICTED: laccase-14-like [Fragaria vesca subsp. vesca]